MTGERLYGGNRETIRTALLDRDGIPWWVLRTYAKRRRELPALLQRPEYRHAIAIQLRSPAAAETFLSEAPGAQAPERTQATWWPLVWSCRGGSTSEQTESA